MRFPKNGQRPILAARAASQREHGYQEIAGRAVDDGEEDLEPRAGRPDRIERQLGRFPQEMACASKSQIRKWRA